MDFLDRKYGPLRIRAWGLIVNMAANALALYGLSRVLAGQEGYLILFTGVGLTVACMAILAVPGK